MERVQETFERADEKGKKTKEKHAGIPSINKKASGLKLRKIMDAHGVSVKEVQKYLGLGSVQSVYHWLNGISMPTVDNLYAMSDLFQVSMDEMVCGNRTWDVNGSIAADDVREVTVFAEDGVREVAVFAEGVFVWVPERAVQNVNVVREKAEYMLDEENVSEEYVDALDKKKANADHRDDGVSKQIFFCLFRSEKANEKRMTAYYKKAEEDLVA